MQQSATSVHRTRDARRSGKLPLRERTRWRVPSPSAPSPGLTWGAPLNGCPVRLARRFLFPSSFSGCWEEGLGLENSSIGLRKVPDTRPDDPARCPGSPAKCPDGSDKCPDGPDKCPDGSDKCPDGPDKCPDGPDKCPDGPAGLANEPFWHSLEGERRRKDRRNSANIRSIPLYGNHNSAF